MRTATRHLPLIFITALALLASACSGASDAPNVEDAGSASNTGSTGTSGQATNGDSAGGETASPTPTLPGWVSDAIDEQEHIRYIANTGGVGVSHRSACETAARIDGSWPDGTELEIVLDSEPGCENWSLLSDGQITSWVSNSYLSLTEPAPSVAPAATASTSTGRQVEVINFFGKLIPTTYLKIKPATYTYNNTVLISGCAQSWHPVGDSAITTTGEIIADPDPQNCGFGAVELVPAYWITTSS
jgi:hypothetical protein